MADNTTKPWTWSHPLQPIADVLNINPLDPNILKRAAKLAEAQGLELATDTQAELDPDAYHTIYFAGSADLVAVDNGRRWAIDDLDY